MGSTAYHVLALIWGIVLIVTALTGNDSSMLLAAIFFGINSINAEIKSAKEDD